MLFCWLKSFEFKWLDLLIFFFFLNCEEVSCVRHYWRLQPHLDLKCWLFNVLSYLTLLWFFSLVVALLCSLNTSFFLSCVCLRADPLSQSYSLVFLSLLISWPSSSCLAVWLICMSLLSCSCLYSACKVQLCWIDDSVSNSILVSDWPSTKVLNGVEFMFLPCAVCD